MKVGRMGWRKFYQGLAIGGDGIFNTKAIRTPRVRQWL